MEKTIFEEIGGTYCRKMSILSQIFLYRTKKDKQWLFTQIYQQHKQLRYADL